MEPSLIDKLIPVVIGFLLTALVGNRLLTGWQRRSWFLQQRFLGQEKEYSDLKTLADEIGSLLGSRIFHTQRLNWVLRKGDDERFNARLQEYDDVVKRWNERLTSFYVRLAILVGDGFSNRLERSVQDSLVDVGAQLDALVSKRKGQGRISSVETAEIERRMSSIQGRAISFNQKLLAVVKSRRTDIYFGRPVRFMPETLKYFSTWYLIKALFVRDVDSLSIVRAPMDA